VAYHYAFPEERTRPAVDLLSRIPSFAPATIIDLGCGPGFSTALLARTFPQAKIVGVDQNEEALQVARAHLPDVHFEKIDIAQWSPAEPYDLVFSNGALQWLPNHHKLLPKILSAVRRDGYLALQIPNNLQEPNRALMRMVAADGPWAKELVPIAKTRPTIEAFEDLHSSLWPSCQWMDLWETTYVHMLDNVWSIIEWMMATGLGPFLTPLGEEEREKFLTLYAKELSRAYPTLPDGKILLRFPRLFILARR
jgi:trans-aconitate 2-methyltransferase